MNISTKCYKLKAKVFKFKNEIQKPQCKLNKKTGFYLVCIITFTNQKQECMGRVAYRYKQNVYRYILVPSPLVGIHGLNKIPFLPPGHRK